MSRHKTDIPIVDLTIEALDEDGKNADGFDKIALLDDPAIEVPGIYLSKALDEDKADKIVSEEYVDKIVGFLEEVGDVIDDTYTEVTEDEYTKAIHNQTLLQKLSVSQVKNTSSKNDVETKDGNGIWLVRYKYSGPLDGKNRDFCRRIMTQSKAGKVYTEEQINRLRNPEFGNYDIFLYKGSYNCRHRWRRTFYFKDLIDNETRNVGNVRAVARVQSDARATTRNAKVSTSAIPKKFELQNIDKQQVIAPLLIPDILIDRDDKNGQYKIRFSKEVIKQLRDKAIAEGKFDDLNIIKDTHKGDLAPAFVLENWIIEDENDKAYTKYGFDIKDVKIGSWMVITQVIDKDFWEKEIKKNKKHSYSIEAFLNMRVLNLKINKTNMEEEKDEITLLKEELERLKKLVGDKKEEDKVEAVSEEEDKVEAKEDESKEEDKVEAKSDEEDKVEAKEDESKEEDKVEAVESDENKDEVTDEESEESTEESVDESTEEESKDEDGSEIDKKFEDLYEEIAKIKSTMSEMSNTTTEKVEMGKDKKSTMFDSVRHLQKSNKKK